MFAVGYLVGLGGLRLRGLLWIVLRRGCLVVGVLTAARFTLVVVVLVCLVVFGVLRVVAVGCVGWSACVSASGLWLVC